MLFSHQLLSIPFFDAAFAIFAHITRCSLQAPSPNQQQPQSIHPATSVVAQATLPVGNAPAMKRLREPSGSIELHQRRPPPPPPPPRNTSWETRRKSLEGCSEDPAPVSFRERSSSKASRRSHFRNTPALKATCCCDLGRAIDRFSCTQQ